MKDDTKKPVVVVHNQQTGANEERPLEEVKKEAEKTGNIPMGIFTLGALAEIVMATTGQ